MIDDEDVLLGVDRDSRRPVELARLASELAPTLQEVSLAVEDRHVIHELIGDVAARGILHDIEEIGTGDLVREAKYFDEEMRESFRRVERAFAERLFGKLGPNVNPMFSEIWRQAKGDDLAGQIVALADLFCVIAYVRWERSMGNTKLGQVERACLNLIDEKFGDNKLLLPIIADATYVEGSRVKGL